MGKLKYHREITALLVVDPYNDFISEGGKIWPRIRAVAEANDCVRHMLQIRRTSACPSMDTMGRGEDLQALC